MERAPIAAFDVDGTLTTRDTFFPFLVSAVGASRSLRSLARHGAVIAGRGDRDTVKSLVLSDLLAGFDHGELATLGEAHAARIAQRWLRLDVVARLSWHQRQGHTTVLVSASLGCYVRPLGEHLQIAEVVCTEMEVGDDGRLTGRMAGGNCRGQAKADRVAALFGDGRTASPLAYAYGNSSGDRELLSLAAEPVWVGRRPLRPAAATVPA